MQNKEVRMLATITFYPELFAFCDVYLLITLGLAHKIAPIAFCEIRLNLFKLYSSHYKHEYQIDLLTF